MYKTFLWVGVIIVVLVGGYFILNNNSKGQDYKNIEYLIEGKEVKLGSENTKYFGNPLKTDLNGDSIPDLVFLVTAQPGGSGTFYYVVAAIQGKDGSYVGSDGYLLGDRIAPQTTEVSQNPKQKNVIVVNYADRKPTDPMTTSPSVGKSAYLKLDPQTLHWGIVEPNFEGESR